MRYRRIKSISALALTLFAIGGTANSSFANLDISMSNNDVNEINMDFNKSKIDNLAYQLKDEFNKRPNDSSESIIRDVYNKNKDLVDTMLERTSISEAELLDFVAKNPNSDAVVKTFKDRSTDSIKAFYQDTEKLGNFVKTYESELGNYYNASSLPEYTFALDDGRVLSIQGAAIGIDEPIEISDIASSKAYTPTKSHSRSYYSWTNLKLLTIYAKGYFSYNGSSLPTAYPDAGGTYVKKGFLSMWQINEWSEGGYQDPKAGNTKVYGAGSFYLGFDLGGGSLHFQTIQGEAGLKCNKKGSTWTYSYY